MRIKVLMVGASLFVVSSWAYSDPPAAPDPQAPPADSTSPAESPTAESPREEPPPADAATDATPPTSEATTSAGSGGSADAPAASTTAAAPELVRIRGVIRGGDREPVPGATILVVGTTSGAISEADGTYVIEGLVPSSYMLEISAPGYASTAVEAKANTAKTLVVDVDVGEINAGEVIVVTGSRSPEKVLDSPATIEYVSANDIKRAAGVSYLSALAKVKGIDFADAGLGDQRISMRGFTTQFNSRLLSMIDGRVAQMPGTGLPQGNAMPTVALDMKAIEVIVGPASALYGPNAHTGVINVITKTPWDESGATIAVRGGTQDLLEAATRIAGTVNDVFGWKMNGQYMRATDFAPDATRPEHYYNTDFFERDLVGGSYDLEGAKLDGTLYYKLPDDWIVKSTYGWSIGDGFALTNNGRNHLRGMQTQVQNLQISGPHLYGQVTRTATNAGNAYPIDSLARAVAAMGSTLPSPEVLEAMREALAFVDDSQLYDAELQYRASVLGVDGTVGVQGRMYLPDSGGTYLADAAGEDIDASEIGGYAQASYKLLDQRLRLVGALRVDHHSDYATQLSPKAAVVVKVQDNHNVRAGYNHAIKSPTILENNLLIQNMFRGNKTGYVVRDAAGMTVDTIDPLSPERVNGFELGYKGIVGNRLFVDAVVYESFYRDFISPLTQSANPAAGTFAYLPDGMIVGEGTPTAGALFTYRNFGAAHVRGADVGVSWRPLDTVDLSSSVSAIDLVDFTQSNPNIAPLLLNVPTLKLKASATISNLGIPNYYVTLSGRYQSAYAFESGYWSSSRFFADQGGKVPDRFVADVGAGYAFPKQNLKLTATVANVLNDQKVDVVGSPIPGRLAFLQLEYAYQGLTY
jgi:outer membrane receptor for ferrienterochelin and colicins